MLNHLRNEKLILTMKYDKIKFFYQEEAKSVFMLWGKVLFTNILIWSII